MGCKINYERFAGTSKIKNKMEKGELFPQTPNPKSLVANLANDGEKIIAKNKKFKG